jgi:hypothetical protein
MIVDAVRCVRACRLDGASGNLRCKAPVEATRLLALRSLSHTNTDCASKKKKMG